MAREARFLVNLRRESAERAFRRRLQPYGYLAAPAYLTRNLAEQARTLRSEALFVVADNGLFDDIGRLAGELEPRAIGAGLLGGAPEEGEEARSMPLRRNAATLLAREAANLAAAVDAEAHLEQQLALRPNAIVGAEDITAALWLRLGIDYRVLPKIRSELRRRNRRVAQLAVQARASTPRSSQYLPVASAHDYDTAFDAGREFASAGLETAAMGFGAFMSDDARIDRVKIRGRSRRLARSLPRRYLGTALAARGFWDGWKVESNNAPKRFHFLGLGAPIMIGVVTVAASETERQTFDATSPIKDAATGTIYVSKPAYLKIRTWKAAARLASDSRERWRCPCPFCRSFLRRHRCDYGRGLAWRARHRGTVRPDDLRGRGGLAAAYPILSQPKAGEFATEIQVARMGHNHWVLSEVTDELTRAWRKSRLEEHLEDVVAAYEAATSVAANAAAVRLSLQIATGEWP